MAFAATTDGERLVGAAMVARRLDELGALRPGLTVDEARDLVWTINSPEVWHLLVERQGWTADAWEAWVARALVGSVLA